MPNEHQGNMTAMQELIEYAQGCADFVKDIDSKEDRYARLAYRDIVQKGKQLLDKEREQIVEAWDNGYALGCVIGGQDYTHESKDDNGLYYFTQKFSITR